MSHQKPEEPSLPQYPFCRECQDCVHGYCSIHGELLVVPNIKKENNFQSDSPQMRFAVKDEVENCNSDNANSSEASGIIPDEKLTSSLNETEDAIGDDIGMLIDGNGDFKPSETALNSENLAEKDSYISRIQAQLDEEIMRDIEAEAKIFETFLINNTFRENLCKEQSKEFVRNNPHALISTQIAQNEVTKGIGKKSKIKLHKTKKSVTIKKPKFQNTDEDAGELDLNSETNINKNTIVIKKQNFQEPNFRNTVDMNSKRESEEVVQKKQKIKTPNNNNCTEKEKTPVINTIIFKCNECGKEFSTRDILTDHILKCIKPKSLVNDSQLKKADTLNSFLPEMYNCDICTFKTNQKRSIETHLKMHSITKWLSCDICEYRCARKSNFNDHMRTHTGEKPFTCDVCEFKCARKTVLNDHIKTHTGEKPFSCNVCQFKCARKYILKRHILTHTGEKPFSCNVCEYKFTQKSHLKVHIRTHTGEKPFACNICEFRCATESTLKVHTRTHTGEKPFCCNICKYRCARTNDLKTHMRTHTGEKRFCCSICEYRCSQKSHLKDHTRTHTGEKPFSCNICEFRCTRKSILNNHIKIHRSEKPFA